MDPVARCENPIGRRFPLRSVLVVMHLAGLLLLLPRELHWDGIGFIERAQNLRQLDAAHLLHAPAIAIASWILSPLSISIETAATAFSAVCSSLALALLARRFELRGLSFAAAWVAAALFTTTPIFLRQSVIVDPQAPTIACLLLASVAAATHQRSPSPRSFLTAMLATFGALGFHVLSILALPWLSLQARRAWLPIAAGAALLGVALVFAEPAELFAYASGFARPSPEADGFLGAFPKHVRGVAWFLREGAPVLSVLALCAAGTVAAARKLPLDALQLGLPFLALFLIYGVPYVGLLVPVVLALALALAPAAIAFPSRLSTAILAIALALQLALALPEAIDRSRRPDPLRASAELVAASLPENSVVLAGELAAHLRRFTRAPCVSLPDLMHRAYGSHNDLWNPLAPIRSEVERHESEGRAVFITTEGLDVLVRVWGMRQEQIAPQGSEVHVLRKEPFLALVPVRSERMKIEGVAPP